MSGGARSGAGDAGVLGIFRHLDTLLAALRAARERNVEIRDVYSPVPSHEVEAFLAPGRSRVQLVTFTGGVLGLIGGMALAIGTALIWNLMTGGKPVTSVMPFLIVGFEITILLGAVATLKALALFAGVPFRRLPWPVYPSGAVGVLAGIALAWAMSGRPENLADVIVLALVGPGLAGLVGALFAAVALALRARAEHWAYPAPAYRAEFSDDRFGVWLGGGPAEAREVLERAGADEVVDLAGEGTS